MNKITNQNTTAGLFTEATLTQDHVLKQKSLAKMMGILAGRTFQEGEMEHRVTPMNVGQGKNPQEYGRALEISVEGLSPDAVDQIRESFEILGFNTFERTTSRGDETIYFTGSENIKQFRKMKAWYDHNRVDLKKDAFDAMTQALAGRNFEERLLNSENTLQISVDGLDGENIDAVKDCFYTLGLCPSERVTSEGKNVVYFTGQENIDKLRDMMSRHHKGQPVVEPVAPQ